MAATYLPQLQHDKAPCMEKSDRGFTKQIKLNVNTKNSLYYDISLRERERHTQMKQKFKSSTLSCLVMFLENEKVFFFFSFHDRLSRCMFVTADCWNTSDNQTFFFADRRSETKWDLVCIIYLSHSFGKLPVTPRYFAP